MKKNTTIRIKNTFGDKNTKDLLMEMLKRR